MKLGLACGDRPRSDDRGARDYKKDLSNAGETEKEVEISVEVQKKGGRRLFPNYFHEGIRS